LNETEMLSPTQRFSSRVDNYVRYRPSYPREVAEMLRTECGLTSDSVVADIGSGTGKLTELLLPHAKRVVAIEPNLEMREAGERLLQPHSNFVSVAGTAEVTTLPEHSVDLIVAGQAFHWFDRERTRAEFGRILKPGGWIALIWNGLQTRSTPFLWHTRRCCASSRPNMNTSTTAMLICRSSASFLEVNHNSDHFLHSKLRLLRSPRTAAFLILRAREGEPGCAAMLTQLLTIFDAHQQDGQVVFLYDTLVYFGQLA
jgi:SAM-dependent methyltransferase